MKMDILNKHAKYYLLAEDNDFALPQVLPELSSHHLLTHLACEPVRNNQGYDFGNSDLATRLRDGGTRLSMEQGYWHRPSADALFLHRNIGVLY